MIKFEILNGEYKNYKIINVIINRKYSYKQFIYLYIYMFHY